MNQQTVNLIIVTSAIINITTFIAALVVLYLKGRMYYFRRKQMRLTSDITEQLSDTIRYEIKTELQKYGKKRKKDIEG